MIIDEDALSEGVTPRIAARLIERHSAQTGRYKRLMDYYMGRHAIENRRRTSEGVPNNRLVCNHAKYIVDITKSYLLGNPVSYAVASGYDIETVKNSYAAQDIATLDGAIEKQMSIYGKSFELVYTDEHSEPKSVCLSPVNTFMVYDSTVDKEPLWGVHYFKRYGLDGSVIGTECLVCDKEAIYTFRGSGDSFGNMELSDISPHYFGDIPMIEYRNNEEEQGDYEQLISLIDAYNTLMSDRVNDKEQFVESFLFLKNMEIDGEQAKKLREERILMGYDENSSAQYLSKVMSEADIKVLADDLKQDIHRFAMVPDLSDQQFGTNLSGVAIKYKLMCFEQQVRSKERYFAKALKKRFELYVGYYSLKGSMQYVPVHRVDVVFTRNMPVNELEVSQMIQNLSGIATAETLLSQLSFVSDPEEEAELAKRERMTGGRSLTASDFKRKEN